MAWIKISDNPELYAREATPNPLEYRTAENFQAEYDANAAEIAELQALLAETKADYADKARAAIERANSDTQALIAQLQSRNEKIREILNG